MRNKEYIFICVSSLFLHYIYVIMFHILNAYHIRLPTGKWLMMKFLIQNLVEDLLD